MKSLLLFSAIAGAVIAIAITSLKGKSNGQVINVEDGFPVNA